MWNDWPDLLDTIATFLAIATVTALVVHILLGAQWDRLMP